MSASTVHWTADAAIAALAAISRDPHATEQERQDAQSEILTITGAVDGYCNRNASERIGQREARRRGLIPA